MIKSILRFVGKIYLFFNRRCRRRRRSTFLNSLFWQLEHALSERCMERWSFREVEIRVNGSDESGLSAGTKRVTFVERWSFVGYRN